MSTVVPIPNELPFAEDSTFPKEQVGLSLLAPHTAKPTSLLDNPFFACSEAENIHPFRRLAPSTVRRDKPPAENAKVAGNRLLSAKTNRVHPHSIRAVLQRHRSTNVDETPLSKEFGTL